MARLRRSLGQPIAAAYDRHRRAIYVLMLIGGLLLLGVMLVLSQIIVRYGQQDRAQHADVIIVLGGGKEGTERRSEHAAALYHQGLADRVLCSGAMLVGEPETPEAGICAGTLAAAGVPLSVIIREERSRSTEQNALYCRDILRAHGWESAVLVSDDYHLWRARWLFEREGITVYPSPAQRTTGGLSSPEYNIAVLREVVAVLWTVGKDLLGLPFTNFGR